MIRETVFVLLMLLCSGYAILRGGGPERAGAILVLLGAAASTILVSEMTSSTSRFSHLELGVLITDLAMYAASLLIALRAERFWPIWMNALLGVELLPHLLAIPDSATLNLTYAILEKIWGYPITLLPAVGAWRHQQRLRLHGTDASWSVSWRSLRLVQPRRSPTV